MDKSEGAGKEATLWLTLRKNHLCRKRDDDVIDKIESISVPNNLTTSPIHAGEKKRKRSKASSTKEAREEGEEEANIDFDDQLLAHRLRSGYNSLTLPHILRIFSARQLYTIRLGRISPWSGTSPLSTDHSHPGEAGTDHLLTSYSGFALSSEDATPFTEHALMHLYRNPSLGKARYTWIHWARRVSAWNNSADREKCADGIVTIQFEQSWSTWRILFAMGMAMALSVLSVLLWVLLGVSPWALPERRGRAERVEGGVMLGVFVMLMQSVVLAVWIALSWMSG
ncbi:hypothetical protein P280DRAFT_401575 [Massarina eburnea CBS 473.64]|uniref:Uncharacterized protein n=1 Tax=Massarina eburnea CBS 473.64 TaxID=1395130 RepID=A0A6A6RWJ9_9PLEO|nr:hypothetical protein P280DRAFT_401575 [Massarina eburnea CBS 473.64]